MMLRTRTMLFAAVAAAWTGGVNAQVQPTLEQDAVAFGTREAVTNMDLSPDGGRAMFVGAGPGKTTVIYLSDIGSGTNKPILYSKGSPETIQWCSFASDSRLVCRFSAMIASDGGFAPVGVLIPIARTMSLDTEGKNAKMLGQQSSESELGIRQYDGSIIDWLPGAGNEILMTRLFVPEASRGVPTNVQRTKNGIGVVRLNVETLATQTVETPRQGISSWKSDGQGHVRLFGTSEVSSETYETGRVKYSYRTVGSRDWKPLVGLTELRDFQPLVIDGATNSLYSIRKYDGRWGLSRTTLDDGHAEALVARDADMDIDHVVTIGESSRVIGYAYDGQDKTIYLDPEFKSLARSLEAALPGHPSVSFVGESANHSKIALFAGSESNPGMYYLFDKAKKSLGELVPVRPNLVGRKFAAAQLMTYRAADGTTISGRLFLPAGGAGKLLPTVIFAGADSGHKDVHGFEWLAQFLAARGYAVFEPRYRGFGGSDAWFNTIGFKGWQTSAGDLSAATRYMISQGVADPARVAILGWSHSGHAALLAAEGDPALYKAVVAIAPITDLGSYKEDWANYTAGNRIAEAMVGVPADASPTRRAQAIGAPVLLFHGTLDVDERITQSRLMRDALLRAGKSVELVEFPGLDRSLDDSSARAAMLTKIGQLLDRTIGR